jgi:hypothetical protein
VFIASWVEEVVVVDLVVVVEVDAKREDHEKISFKKN